MQKCIYFNDGAGSQYKNYKAFSNLCRHESEFCDGIQGTVKCLVSNANLWALQEPIDTLLKMFGTEKISMALNLYLFLTAKLRVTLWIMV